MNKTLMLAAAIAVVLPSFALADGDGAITGGAGGAVAGAVVGGPVGAAVGGAAGAIIGGAATGPDHKTVVVEHPVPAGPCRTRTTQTTNDNGYNSTTQTTNCPN